MRVDVLLLLVIIGLSGTHGYLAADLYANNSLWRAKLPSNAPVSSSSASYVTDLLRQINAIGYMWINTNQYDVRLYLATSTSPKVKVSLPSGSDPLLQQKFNAVPWPKNAYPTVGTDASMTIWNQQTDEVWEFWRLTNATKSWQCTWGGYMKGMSKNAGFYGPPQSKWGTSAGSLGPAGGTVLISEAQKLSINHALGVTLQDFASGFFAAPAQRTDGNGKSPIPQGTRFRLPATFNVASISDPFARAIATALRDYGMVTRDTSGGVNLIGEDAAAYGGNPWATIFNNRMPSVVLSAIPWSQLVAVDPSWQPWNPRNQWYQRGTITGPSTYTVAASQVVYDDKLASGWKDYSWGTHSLAYTSDHYAGTSCISFTLSGANALYLYNSAANGIDTTNYNAIQMWVKAADDANRRYQGNSILQGLNGSGVHFNSTASLGNYYSLGVATSWTKLTIPFTDLGWTSGQKMTAFWLQAQFSGSGSSTIFVDNISLVRLTAL